MPLPIGTQNLTNLHKAVRSHSRRLTRLEPIRADLQLLSDRTQYSWEERLDRRRFLNESHGEFMELQKQLMEHLSFLHNDQSLRALLERIQASYSRVLADHKALELQSADSRALEDRLSRLHFRVMEKEKSLSRSSDKLLALMLDVQPLRTSSSTPSTVSRSTSPSVRSVEASSLKFPPLLLALFDKIGDVKVMRERLYRLEMDHREARVLRTFEADQCRLPESSDEEFLASYNDQYEEANDELVQAMEAVAAAEKACLDNGLDIGQYTQHLQEPDFLARQNPDAIQISQTPDSPSTLALNETLDSAPIGTPLIALAIREEISSVFPPVEMDNFEGDRGKDRSVRAAQVADWVDAVNKDADAGTKKGDRTQLSLKVRMSRSWSV